MRFFNSLFNSKILGPVLVSVVLLYIYSLWGRIPDVDDAWLGEYAYWFEKLGFVRSELFRGLTGQEERFVVHHKLLTIHGALFIKLFGFSVYSLKSVSLLYFAVFIWLFYLYATRWKKLLNREEFIFSLIILFSFTQVFKYSFLYRPESMVMCIGFSGYVVLEKFLDKKNASLWFAFASGLLFGLTLFAHLNSLILIAAAGFLLLLNQRFIGILFFGLGTILTSSLYFYDFSEPGSLDLWIYQFFSSPAIDSLSNIPPLLRPVMNLLMEHMRYFHNLEIIVFSSLLIVSIAIGFKFLWQNHRNLLHFTLLIAVLTGIIAMHKSRQYFLPFVPYLILLITLTFKAIREGQIQRLMLGKSNRFMLYILPFALFFIFIIVSNYYNLLLSVQKFSAGDNHLLTAHFAGEKSKEMNVVAPMTFIFNEIDNYNRIQSEMFYKELNKSDSTIYGDGFLVKADDYDIDLIMLTPYFIDWLGLNNFQNGEIHENYQVIDKNEQLIVLKRIHQDLPNP